MSNVSYKCQVYKLRAEPCKKGHQDKVVFFFFFFIGSTCLRAWADIYLKLVQTIIHLVERYMPLKSQ